MFLNCLRRWTTVSREQQLCIHRHCLQTKQYLYHLLLGSFFLIYWKHSPDKKAFKKSHLTFTKSHICLRKNNETFSAGEKRTLLKLAPCCWDAEINIKSFALCWLSDGYDSDWVMSHCERFMLVGLQVQCTTQRWNNDLSQTDGPVIKQIIEGGYTTYAPQFDCVSPIRAVERFTAAVPSIPASKVKHSGDIFVIVYALRAFSVGVQLHFSFGEVVLWYGKIRWDLGTATTSSAGSAEIYEALESVSAGVLCKIKKAWKGHLILFGLNDGTLWGEGLCFRTKVAFSLFSDVMQECFRHHFQEKSASMPPCSFFSRSKSHWCNAIKPSNTFERGHWQPIQLIDAHTEWVPTQNKVQLPEKVVA